MRGTQPANTHPVNTTTTNHTVQFDIPSYLGGGSGSASVPAATYTEAVLKFQAANPKLLVERQAISHSDALAAGYRIVPRAEDRDYVCPVCQTIICA